MSVFPRPAHPAGGGTAARSGQVVLFLLLVFIAILVLALMNVDSFFTVRRKNQTQNAGDAAALAAARWQAATLNLEGELNLMHALAACENETNAIAGINALQTRLAYTGPIMGLFAAQAAAKQNHMFVDPEMTALVTDHAQEVRNLYSGGGDKDDAYPPPWPGAWEDYAAMIETAARDGIAAGPGNVRYFDTAGGHMLLNRAFYQAINGRNWCWFFFHAMSLLEGYTSYHDWGPLPAPEARRLDNSEIFGVGVRGVEFDLATELSADALAKAADAWGYDDVTAKALADSGVMVQPGRWYFYDMERWGAWTAIDPYGKNAFPVVGPVKPEFNVNGAAAVCRVTGKVEPVSPAATEKSVAWSAAAKPFGALQDEDGQDATVTAIGGFVVPAFRAVRLIPLDAADGADMDTADADWITHVRHHLRPYMENGPSASTCPYCQALAVWESEGFRKTGLAWLEVNSGTCQRGHGGSGGSSGGTSHGH